MILILTAAGASASVHPLALHKPPFKGTLLFDAYTHAHGCGSVASFTISPSFNLTTGIGTVSSKSKATGCGLPHHSDDGVTEALIGFVTPSIVAVGSQQNYTMNSSVNVSWTLNATPGSPAGGPMAWASAFINIQMGLIDLDNNSNMLGGCAGILLGNTTNHSSTGLVAGYFSFRCNAAPLHWIAPTVVGHHVAIEFWVQGFTFAHTPSGTVTHASASLNLATKGHQFAVVSWSYI